MQNPLRNGLVAERERLGWTQRRVAEAVGISRQSYSAIESGRSVPSTDVALRLARAMGLPLEELFRLAEEEPGDLRVRWGSPGRALGRRVRLTRVAGQWIALAAGEAERPSHSADGVVVEEGPDELRVRLLPGRPPEAGLTVVGCDPAFGIVAQMLRQERGIEVCWSQRGSRAAMEALARGEAHVAGAHLQDPDTGEMNGPWVRSAIPFACTRVTFADWDQGLVVPPGNPNGIASVADLARPEVRFLNREPGSGSRLLLDEALDAAGVPAARVNGYTTAAAGHFAVAEAIAAGLADAGVAIRAAGAAFGLDVIPLRTERYELIIADHFLDLPAVAALLQLLRRRPVRAQVEAMQGYDVARMGLPA